MKMCFTCLQKNVKMTAQIKESAISLVAPVFLEDTGTTAPKKYATILSVSSMQIRLTLKPVFIAQNMAHVMEQVDVNASQATKALTAVLKGVLMTATVSVSAFKTTLKVSVDAMKT